MIRFNQPGLKKFFTYVFSFIFLTLFVYLGIPFFFDYKSNTSDIEKKIFKNFGLNLNIASKVKYNIFPSPRLNLENVEILSFSENFNNIGYIEKVVLRIPFKKLVNLRLLDFNSVDLVGAVFNIETSEVINFKNYINNFSYEKPVELNKSKINLLSEGSFIFGIDIKKMRITGKDSFVKLDLKGKIFDTKIKIYFQNKKFDNNSIKNIAVSLPEIGLNLKLTANPEKENDKDTFGKANITFPNNQIYFDYTLDNKVLNISSSRLINNYFKGQLLGDIILFPFSTFVLNLDINLLKFKNILNSKYIKNRKFFSELVPFNKKINGNTNIQINEIASSSNIINSGNAKLEFRNGVLLVKEVYLVLNKIGNIKLDGKILQQKKKKFFIFKTKINLEDSKVFYSRFLIPKKNRIDLIPISINGKINLRSYEVKLDKLIFENKVVKKELDEAKLLLLQEKLNEIFSQNSLNNILKYSNFRKIIQSFFQFN